MATKTIDILDYKGNHTSVDLDLDKVQSVELTIITGDEILEVTFKDGDSQRFDSSACRAVDYFDWAYTVYDPEKGVNLLEDPEWLGRKSSYDRL